MIDSCRLQSVVVVILMKVRSKSAKVASSFLLNLRRWIKIPFLSFFGVRSDLRWLTVTHTYGKGRRRTKTNANAKIGPKLSRRRSAKYIFVFDLIVVAQGLVAFRCRCCLARHLLREARDARWVSEQS